jgi:hypothetical protein
MGSSCRFTAQRCSVGRSAVCCVAHTSIAIQRHSGEALSWPPAATFTWIPHERGMGPGPVWIFGPDLPNIVVATLLFYFAFSVWSRRRSLCFS